MANRCPRACFLVGAALLLQAPRASAQTSDGYLWLGTDEGLARFDGYEFTVFNKNSGALPGNSVTALCAGRDGGLWIGTSAGVTRYHGNRFRTYSTQDGLPDNAVTALMEDRGGGRCVSSPEPR